MKKIRTVIFGQCPKCGKGGTYLVWWISDIDRTALQCPDCRRFVAVSSDSDHGSGPTEWLSLEVLQCPECFSARVVPMEEGQQDAGITHWIAENPDTGVQILTCGNNPECEHRLATRPEEGSEWVLLQEET